MNLCVGMRGKTFSVDGEYVEGDVLNIYSRTFVLVSESNAQRYLVKLDSLDSSYLLQEEIATFK